MFRLYRLYGLNRLIGAEGLFHVKQSFRLSGMRHRAAVRSGSHNRYISHGRHNILRKPVRRFCYDEFDRHTSRY